jgi:hypothetical protein
MLRAMTVATGAAAALVFSASSAHADDLVVRTRELGAWGDALDALRRDLGSEGRVLHIQVRAGEGRVPCARYDLVLDDDARRALRLGACDVSSGETAITLQDRSALFDESFHVPRPRPIALTAVLKTTIVAIGSPEGGMAVHCTMGVQPYLDDLLHGTRVLLTPEHYELRPDTTRVSVSPAPGGWTLDTTSRVSIHLAYEVVDRATGTVVLRQDTTLVCGEEKPPEAPSIAPPMPTPPPLPPLPTLPLAPAPVAPRGIECRWGIHHSKRGGKSCNESPVAHVATWGTIALVTTAASSYCLNRALHGNAKGESVCAGVGGFYAAAFWAITAPGLYYLLRPREYLPTVGVLDHGAALGLSGAF